MPSSGPVAAFLPGAKARKFVNANHNGSHFYYDGDSISIQYFDAARQQYANFIPSAHEPQHYVCYHDGTAFTFYPDGSGLHQNYQGPKRIPAGTYDWMPRSSLKPAIVPTVVFYGLAGNRPPSGAVTSPPPGQGLQPTHTSEDDSSEDERLDDDGYNPNWKYGLE